MLRLSSLRLVVVALLASALPSATATVASGPDQFSVILTADPGTFSGYPEAIYILRALQQSADISQRLPFCLEAHSGLLSSQPVIVVVTGIGITQAAACMENILDGLAGQIRRVFFLGTSGWSPAEGGVTTAPACTPRQAPVNRIGDVCVSAASTNWDCHFCEWAPSDHRTLCQLPPCHGHDRSDVFGPCSPAGGPDLAAAVAQHAASVTFPNMSVKLASYVQSYWKVTTQGTRLEYVVPPVVKILGPSQCAEATSSTMWSGLPNEMLCRQYLGSLDLPKRGARSGLRGLLDPGKYGGGPDGLTCVAAMEGAGWMPVLLRWKTLRLGRDIPFVNVRAASNYVHRPVGWDASGWRELAWLSEQEMQDFVTEGYKFAILTSSTVILSFFQSEQRLLTR